MLNQRFLYGLVAGAVLGWWLNSRAVPRLPEAGPKPHAGYSKRMR